MNNPDQTQANRRKASRKATLDKDLEKINLVEDASRHIGRRLAAPGAAFLFLVAAMLMAVGAMTGHPESILIVLAAALAAYMAMNIGANDVANNIGAAVGARAMSIGTGLVLAAICEIAGALISGSDVVRTIATGIVRPDMVQGPVQLSLIMIAALIAAAAWINIATWINAPVSTTHSIVGGVMGAGVAAAGVNAVNWSVLGGIAVSWVVSPILGALIAVAMLAFIKTFIIYTPDKIAAARRWVPLLIALMLGSFTTYILIVLPNEIVFLPMSVMLGIGFVTGVLGWMISHPLIASTSEGLENRNQSLRVLFRIPLIFSAALLSFAHGANDVSNAIGPLAAIVSALEGSQNLGVQSVPLWELTIGGLGIAIGLLLFGPRLVNLVGKEITKLNPMRAYCVALSAAVTVILASSIGAPVSSTHIAVGSVFGVGLFREWYIRRSAQRQTYLSLTAQEQGMTEVAPVKPPQDLNQAEERRRRLVRRSHLLSILAAWMITVPLSAALAGGVVMLMLRFLG